MKRMVVALVVLSVIVLSGCKAKEEDVVRYIDNHNDVLESFDVVEFKTSVIYVISGSETALDSYIYQDNVNEVTCMATGENDDSGFNDYTVGCAAIYAPFNSKLHGFVPYDEDGVYPVHPLHIDGLIIDEVLSFFTDEDVLEETDTQIRYRKEVYYSALNERFQFLVSRGFELDFHEIPVRFNATYNKETETFTVASVDNFDVMQHIYNNNFGTTVDWEEYYIEFTFSEYTGEFRYFKPTEDLVFDEDVNYFEDGDHYGYRRFYAGDVIEGELDYDDDQDIIEIFIGQGGTYNLEYVTSNNQETMLFSLYSDGFELMKEGVIGDDGHELQDVYIYPGKYYIVLFTHATADAYKLELVRLQ